MSGQRTISDEVKWHDCLSFGLIQDLMERARISRGEARELLRRQGKRRAVRDLVLTVASLAIFWSWPALFNELFSITDPMPPNWERSALGDNLAFRIVFGMCLPFAMPIGVVVLTLWLHTREMRRLADTPACFACTYDLSGAPEDAPHVCTECGFIAPHMRSRASGGVSDAPGIHSPPTEQPPSHPP